MIVCPQCGTKNKDGSQRCKDCGATLDKGTVNVIDAPVDAPLFHVDSEKTGRGSDNFGDMDLADKLSMVAFVFSVVSAFLCGISSFFSLIVSIVAYTRVKGSGTKSEKMAKSGMIISIVMIIVMFGLSILSSMD